MKVKHQLLAALGCFLALGLAAVALVALLPAKQGGPGTLGQVVLSDRAQNAFARARVTNASGSYLVEAQAGGGYSCDLLAGLPANQQAFEQLAQQCTSLTAFGPISPAQSRSGEGYGFERPLARAEVEYSDGGGILIELGNPVAGCDQYYLQIDGGPSVYQVDRQAVRWLLADRSAYLDLSLAPAGADGSVLPTRIELQQAGLPDLALERLPAPQQDGAGGQYRYRLHCEDRVWYADPQALVTWFGGLCGLRADGVVTLNPTQAELQEYGLAEGSCRQILRVTALGRTVCLRIGESTGEFCYLLREGVPAVYRLPREKAIWDGATEYALMSRYVAAPLQGELSGLLIEEPAGSWQIALQGGEVTLNGTPVSREAFDSFYLLLCSLRAEYELEEPPQQIAPALTVTFFFKEAAAGGGAGQPDQPGAAQPAAGRQLKLRLIPYGVRRYAIELDGEARYAVRGAYLTQLLAALPALLEGQPVDSSW